MANVAVTSQHFAHIEQEHTRLQQEKEESGGTIAWQVERHSIKTTSCSTNMPTPHHFKAFASSSNLLLVTKIVTVSSMGIFTGTALCYNAIVMPSLRKFASTSSLAVWSEMFLLTKPIQVSAIAISALGGSILYYKTHDPFYLLGGMMMAIIVPYTKLLFDPMDNRLLDIRKHGKDDRGVEEMLMRWDTLHFGRTLLGYGATVVTLYAALRGH